MRESTPIKVMHIIARMNVGGPAVEIVELMRGLDTQVVSQRLVTGYCDDDEADYLETQAPDIQATRIQGLGRSIRPTDDAKALAQLIKLIRSSRPDIVHTHTAKAGVLGRLAAKLSGTGARVIHTYHGHLLYGYFGRAKTKALIQIENQLAMVTDRLVTISDKVRDDLLDAGIGSANQYAVIRSGVRLGPLPDKRKSRRELGIPEDSVVVSMIGRLTKIKRPDRFADVVEITKQRGLNIHYLVAGGGDQEQALRERVKGSNLPVSILGWRDDLEALLAATDILILTSDNEGAPLSLIQAAHAGIPTVATAVGGVREIVVDEITGLVADPDAKSLARAVMRLVDDAEERKMLGQQAKEISEQRFQHTSMLEEFTHLYIE